MTTAMAEQSWLTHSPKTRDTLPPAPSNLEGEQPLSQSLNSYTEKSRIAAALSVWWAVITIPQRG